MELNELFALRRSVRSFRPTGISRETLEEIIRDARQAPSWKNSETARSYVVHTPEMLEKLRACLPDFNLRSTAGAPVFIVSTFVKDVACFTNGVPTNEMGNQVGAYDLGLYHAYLILKARDLGIDSLIMGIRDEKALRTLLEIPENEEISMVLALGCRDDSPVAIRPRKPVEEIAKFF